MTTKTQKQFRLDSLTVSRLHALAAALDMTQVDVVTHAINDFYNAHMSTPLETRDLDELTEDVCNASPYPHTTEMRQECRDWLADGDPNGRTVEDLAAEWDERLRDAGICLRVGKPGIDRFEPDEDVSWWPEVEADAELTKRVIKTLQGWPGWSQVWLATDAMGDTELYFRP